MATKYIKNIIKPAVQVYQIKKRYSILNSHFKSDVIFWEMLIKPTPLSKTYKVKFKYQLNKNPEIYLVNQGILKNKKDKPPHCYDWGFKSINEEWVKLCLYYPRKKEWHSGLLIADTIIPWTVEWLYYYEIWRITGKWYGGGHEFEKKDKN